MKSYTTLIVECCVDQPLLGQEANEVPAAVGFLG